MEILLTIIPAVLSIIVASLGFSENIQKFISYTLLKLPEEKQISYAERLSMLVGKLNHASNEVDEVLNEIAQVAEHRQSSISKLEITLKDLEGKEKDLKNKIATLEKTPIEVAEHFAKLISAGEKRSARRDYLLFGTGVLVTTTIAIVVQYFAS